MRGVRPSNLVAGEPHLSRTGGPGSPRQVRGSLGGGGSVRCCPQGEPWNWYREAYSSANRGRVQFRVQGCPFWSRPPRASSSRLSTSVLSPDRQCAVTDLPHFAANRRAQMTESRTSCPPRILSGLPRAGVGNGPGAHARQHAWRIPLAVATNPGWGEQLPPGAVPLTEVSHPLPARRLQEYGRPQVGSSDRGPNGGVGMRDLHCILGMYDDHEAPSGKERLP
jgi:hypothetical protein